MEGGFMNRLEREREERYQNSLKKFQEYIAGTTKEESPFSEPEQEVSEPEQDTRSGRGKDYAVPVDDR